MSSDLQETTGNAITSEVAMKEEVHPDTSGEETTVTIVEESSIPTEWKRNNAACAKASASFAR